MKGNVKKLKNQESGKSCFSSIENGSLLISSLKLKKDKKDKLLKSSSQNKAKKTESLKKIKKKKGSNSGKIISKKILKKAIDSKSLSKTSSLKERKGEHLSDVVSRKNGKKLDKNVDGEKIEKGKDKKKEKDKKELDEPSRLRRRTRYLMIKMKLEQNLIDAYSGEGWKGQSREKIRPEKELLRARKQILQCKLGLRDAIHQLDSLSTVGCIEDSVMAPDGSVSHEHIFCAKCKSNEVSPDNDIVLCDGTCNCAFHQQCLDPPLDTENIPPGDQGWYCNFCDCRMEIIEAMNAHLGTQFTVDSCWQDIFKEEATLCDGEGILLNPEEEWPSDDSEDDDYDPESGDNSISRAGTDDDVSDDASSATSLDSSSDGEVLPGSRKWEMETTDPGNHSIYSSLDSDETSEGQLVCGRRQRRSVDYKKLYDEMFGKDSPAYDQFSEDEDWGPHKTKRREKESDTNSTLKTISESEKKVKKHEIVEISESEKKVKKPEIVELKKKPSVEPRVRRTLFRIPPIALKRLREVFAEDELPSRTVKENLSKELGIDHGKVSKWFKNARYFALKLRKEEKARERDSSSLKFPFESRLAVKKIVNSDPGELRTTSTKAKTCTPKKSKQALQRKESKSIRGTLKRKRTSIGPPSKSNEISDDVSLKLLKSKTKRDKKMNSIPMSASEVEMERLSRTKVRLENLKQKLLTLQNGKARKTNKNQLHQESVILVPIATLREKN